jgi:hypothetical protein
MNPVQVKAVPEDLKISIPQLMRDYKTALSYVSFYSGDSPFVIQALQKCHRDFQRILQACGSVLLYRDRGKLLLNDLNFSEVEDLDKIFQEKDIRGVQFFDGLTVSELTLWMKQIASPFTDPSEKTVEFSHITLLSNDTAVTIIREEVEEPAAPMMEPVIFQPEEAQPFVAVAQSEPTPVQRAASSSLQDLVQDENFPLRQAFPSPLPENEEKANEALLSFVAEAWQYSQMQKRSSGSEAETAALAGSFGKLFGRLLDRMEKASPGFANIRQWFKATPGELLETDVVASMYPLLESAVRNRWTAVLFDPATEGLITEALAYWGANGKQELVEKTVRALADHLNSEDSLEKQLALTHLMDARPWVRNAELAQKVLEQLNQLLANESIPSLYQTALLLAWDLTEPVLAGGGEQPVLVLLSTLHFHADEETTRFPERLHIARHWLFERSNPDLTRRFVRCAFQAGWLPRFPLLGEIAARPLLEDFFKAQATEKSAYLQLFAEMKEPIRSALAELLADSPGEEGVVQLIPILRVCGMDPALSLQLAAWLSKGSRELKLNLLGVIEEVGDQGAGPALRLAVFDDSEEIAALAARVIGKIGFSRGLPVLLKAVKIREDRFPSNEQFLISVCQSLGDLCAPEGIPFLQDIARKKALLRGKNYSLPIRLEAIGALTKINQPEVWTFLGSLMEEKNPALQESLDKIIHDKIQSI